MSRFYNVVDLVNRLKTETLVRAPATAHPCPYAVTGYFCGCADKREV